MRRREESPKAAGDAEVIVLLDRSGSMETIAKDMCGGFDAFVREQAPHTRLTLVQFDSQGIDTIHEALPCANVPPLTLVPRGGTPLLDALGDTLTKARTRLDGLPAEKRPKVIVLVLTDGEENSSRRFTKPQIKALVETLTGAGWQFVYLGANVDAYAEASQMGFVTVNSAGYAANGGGVRAAYAALASNTKRYAAGASASMSFSTAQVSAMNGNSTPGTDTDASLPLKERLKKKHGHRLSAK